MTLCRVTRDSITGTVQAKAPEGKGTGVSRNSGTPREKQTARDEIRDMSKSLSSMVFGRIIELY